jgi:hypothetical protein
MAIWDLDPAACCAAEGCVVAVGGLAVGRSGQTVEAVSTSRGGIRSFEHSGNFSHLGRSDVSAKMHGEGTNVTGHRLHTCSRRGEVGCP